MAGFFICAPCAENLTAENTVMTQPDQNRLTALESLSASRLKVAVIHDYHSVAEILADWRPIRERAEVEFISQIFESEDEVVAAIGDADIVCAMRELLPFTGSLFERLPQLRCLVATGEANYRIDFDAARSRDIEVIGTPNGDYGRIATAELAWALILAATRNLVTEDRATRNGAWQHSVSGILHGKTLGLVGLGRIGRIMAVYASAFGMRILAWSPHLDPAMARESLTEPTTFDHLMRQSDVVSLHLVPSAETTGLISVRTLALMKPTAVLVNTSRGELIDEDALVEALEDGRLAGAALDVFRQEPLPAGHPLLARSDVVLSPHLAGFTRETLAGWHQGSVDAVLAWLDGREPAVRHRNRPDSAD